MPHIIRALFPGWARSAQKPKACHKRMGQSRGMISCLIRKSYKDSGDITNIGQH